MSSVMPYPTEKIKCFPRRHAALVLVALALLALSPAKVKATQVDHAWLSISLDTLVHDDLLWQPASVQSLNRFLHQRAVDFGSTLSARLAERRPQLALRMLPTAPDAEHWQLRERGEKNSLLITIDIRSDYGLVAGGRGSAWLSALSSFWSAPSKQFTFALRSTATLSATRFDRSGLSQPLMNTIRITREEQVDCDLFAAGNAAAEWDRLTDLTDTLLPRLIEPLLNELGSLPVDLASRPEPAPATAFPFLIRVVTDHGQGSAFVISRRGFAATSLHAIEDTKWLKLEWSNGLQLNAFIVERLPSHDLAILSFPHRGEEPVELGDDHALPVDTSLNVIGYPGLKPTVVVARYLGRERHQEADVLKISAALEAGYSGGPVLDHNGRVIGMTVSRATERPEIGYLISATSLRSAIAPWRDLPRARWARAQDSKNSEKN